MVLMFTDLVGSVDLKTRLGAGAYLPLINRHDALFQEICASIDGAEIVKDTGDGFLARFATPTDAVVAALRFQAAMDKEAWKPEPIRVCVGLHIGQVAETGIDAQSGKAKLIGLAADFTARIMDLAEPGQILMTRGAFDDARQYLREHPDGESELKWLAHGPYLFKGADEPIPVFEVGAKGTAPLRAPGDSNKARRAVTPGEEELLGWRPAIGREIPGRPKFVLERELGEGGFGEVWLARHEKLKTRRAFKFCFDADRLRSFKREMTLFRLLKEALGDRPDIATLHDVRLDLPPFFLESEYSEAGDLKKWCEEKGGAGALPLAQRLDLFVRTCDAVSAAHSVGILHKDLKPSNVFLRLEDGEPRPVLADFGIGLVIDPSQLADHGVTMAGFTETIGGNDSSRTGTRVYSPPELLAGKPFTVRGDVYALGVLLYQLVVGDLDRPLAVGWERDIDDALLREDVAACVEGDPDRRLASASELAERIRTLAERRDARARLQRRGRIRRVAVAGGLAVFVALGIVAFMLQRESGLRRAAEADRNVARTAEAAARSARAAEVTERVRAERQVYIANVRAAQTALRFNDVTEARFRLEAAAEEFRGWEWKHLHARLNQSLRILEAGATVRSVAAAPDGRIAVAASSGVRVWNGDTGELVVEKRGLHKFHTMGVAFSPDGRHLLTTGTDKTMRLFDAATLDPIRSYDPGVSCERVMFTDGGKTVVGVGRSRVYLFDRASARRRVDIEGHSFVAFSSDGTDMATFDRDGDVHGTVDQRPFGPFRFRPDAVGLFMDPKGYAVIAVGEDGLAMSWAPKDGHARPVFLAGHTGEITCAAMGDLKEGGGMLATGSTDGTIRLWDDSAKAMGTLRGHKGRVTSVALGPGARWLVSGATDETVRIWPLLRGDGTTRLGNDEFVFAADNLLVCPEGRYLNLYDLASTERLVSLERIESTKLFALTDDGRTLVTSPGKNVHRWDLRTATKIPGEFPPAPDYMIALRVAGNTLVGVTRNGETVTWDLTTPDRMTRAKTGAVGRFEWKMPDGKVGWMRSFSTVDWAAISPDGRRVVTEGGITPAKLWDVGTGRLLRSLVQTKSEVTAGFARKIDVDLATSAAFSKDGSRIAIGTAAGVVHLVDAATGTPVWTLRGHSRAVKRLAFSPEGIRLASTAKDGTLRLWDLVAGQEILVLRPPEMKTYGLAFSPDGSRLAVSVNDDTLLFETKTVADRRTARVRARAHVKAARGLVEKLYEKLVVRSHVVKAIREDASLSDPVRCRALLLARTSPFEDVLHVTSREAGKTRAHYERVLLRIQGIREEDLGNTKASPRADQTSKAAWAHLHLGAAAAAAAELDRIRPVLAQCWVATQIEYWCARAQLAHRAGDKAAATAALSKLEPLKKDVQARYRRKLMKDTAEIVAGG